MVPTRMKAASTSKAKKMSDEGGHKKAAEFIKCLSVSLSVFLSVSVFVFVCVVTNYLNGRVGGAPATLRWS